MKFLYEFRTPDNEKHQGAIRAADKEAAYAALKKQGIKPCRFSEAPGFFNKLFGKGKRWMVIAVLGAGCLVLGALMYTQGTSYNAQDTTGALDRCQVYGDPAIISHHNETNWREAFTNEGDRILAMFAQPGRPIPAQLNLPFVGRDKAIERYGSILAGSIRPEVVFAETDGNELRTMKRIVVGMKEELRDYVRDGGTPALYFKRLIDRQGQEVAMRNRIIEEAKREQPDKVDLFLLERNTELRTMGIRPLVLSEVRQSSEGR